MCAQANSADDHVHAIKVPIEIQRRERKRMVFEQTGDKKRSLEPSLK